MLGQEHLDIVTSIDNLSLVLRRQGKYIKVKAIHRQALEGREKVLGRKHLDTLTSIANLALTYIY